MIIESLGWAATAVFVASYFCTRSSVLKARAEAPAAARADTPTTARATTTTADKTPSTEPH